MLNLSDKDLDRLSQEAAQQHEPGDIIGPKFWDKLEARLDRDLGKVNPNPARGIRRLPYYYAPVVLVLLGVSYYLVRLNGRSQKGASSGSPPLTVVRPAPAEPLKPASSSQNPVSSSKNSTLTEPSNTVPYPGTADAPSSTSGTSGTSARPGSNLAAASARPGSNAPAAASSTSRDATALNTPAGTNLVTLHHRHNHITGSNPNNTANLSSAAHKSGTSVSGTSSPGGTARASTGSDALTTTSASTGIDATTNATTTGTPTPTTNAATTRDLTYSGVRGPVRLAKRSNIDDSALRAFNLATIHQLIHKDGLRINRSLEIGIVAGPDYTSVNSLAGDRPGSTIGVTVDYQVANHLYLGTGLLYTKKVFAAAPQDYKIPPDYYSQNGIGMGGGTGVAYIKGTFSMLEIPLNLRYDFSTAGNPTFFANIGTSSYLFTREDCGYYYSLYNPRALQSKGFTYNNYPDNLFATLNLSLGAEFGISNSLSMVLSPYVKIPTRGIGFGQVQLSSVGIDFALRFAPVLSRKR